MGAIDTLVANKYLVDLVGTTLAVILTWILGGGRGTTTKAGLITITVMNFNISLLFVQYFGDLERIKFIWIVVWILFFIVITAAYALGRGSADPFAVSKGIVPAIVRKIGSPLISGCLVFGLYIAVDYYFAIIGSYLSML